MKRIHKHTNPRQVVRFHRKTRIKNKFANQRGNRVRMVPYRSNRFLSVQIVNDLEGRTLVHGNTQENEFAELKSKKGLEAAKALGLLVGKRAIENKIEQVIFDRNGYDYHGRIQAIAEGAREAGLRI